MDNGKAIMAPGEQARIDAALEALAKDDHAPREISVKYVLAVFKEYPKHIGEGINTVTVNNADEEKAALAAIEASKVAATETVSE